MTDNTIMYQARLHWILFFWPVVLFGFTLFLVINYDFLYQPAMVMVLVALFWLIMVGVNYYFSSLTIKKNQIVVCTGFLIRQTLDIAINKIESIDIRQSLVGTLLNYGSLVITGTGGTRQMVTFLNKPLTCRRYIEQMMHS